MSKPYIFSLIHFLLFSSSFPFFLFSAVFLCFVWEESIINQMKYLFKKREREKRMKILKNKAQLEKKKKIIKLFTKKKKYKY